MMKSPIVVTGMMHCGGRGPFHNLFQGAWILFGDEGESSTATGRVVVEVR
jgi:hypothetical protein